MDQKEPSSITSINTTALRNLIYTIRNKQVMLDSDLAMLFRVETKVLNQAVNRNLKRFPERFSFRLTKNEAADLRSQIVTLHPELENRRYGGVIFLVFSQSRAFLCCRPS